MLSVGIITAPRDTNYISESLESYFDAWDIQPHVFEEPGVLRYFGHSRVIVHRNERTLGMAPNWYSAARYMVENTESPFIMICEDDILWREGSRDKIERLLKAVIDGTIERSKIGFISPYCSMGNAPKELGWQKPNTRKSGWFGSLSTIWPRSSLMYMMEHREVIMQYATMYSKKQEPVHLDYALGRTIMESGRILLTHSPTLVLHIGDVSTVDANNTANARTHPARQPNV